MAFFTHLPSSSSINFFPDNRPSSYRTKLPKSFSFLKSYEVALTEISYVNSIKQFVSENQNKIEITKFHSINLNSIGERSSEKLIISLEKDYYGSIHALIHDIRQQSLTLLDDTHVLIEFDFEKNRVVFNIPADLIKEIKISPRLGKILGFQEELLRKGDFSLEKVVAEDPVDLYFGSTRLFVYSDIVQSQIVGDSFAPLLYSFSLKGEERQPITISPIRSYIDLQRKNIESIYIYICNEYGEEAIFDKGSTSVTLHFRPKKERENNGDRSIL